jgi:hypothetical protein
MDILQAIADPKIFAPFLGTDHSTWRNWFAALAALYGLRTPRRQADVIKVCTGRDRLLLPANGFDTALFLTGRRSGKSRIAALIGAFEATLAGHEKKLAMGEKGVVGIFAPTKKQARVVRDYIRSIFSFPLLAPEVVRETDEGFELKSGIFVEIHAGDHRSARGFTLVCAIVDELAFFGVDDECRVRSDTELIRALRPGLATVRGKLVCITTPYARKGWCFTTWKRCFGNDTATALVWNAPTRLMNTTLSQSIVDEAIAEDLQAAKSEYLAEFRDDVAEFLPRSLIESLVVPGRTELLPRSGISYSAFVDISGGRWDDAALAIAHRTERKVVVDLLRRYRPPFNPHSVIGKMVEELRCYGICRVTGDNYGAEFVAQGFQCQGTAYAKAEKAKSLLYLELLPRVCSNEIELLDDVVLVNQLAGLERRTRSGGRDSIDHPQGSHDDLANVIAGVADILCKRTIYVGALKGN